MSDGQEDDQNLTKGRRNEFLSRQQLGGFLIETRFQRTKMMTETKKEREVRGSWAKTIVSGDRISYRIDYARHYSASN